MKQNKECTRYFFVIFVVLVFYIAFLLVKPFISSILAAAVLAYLFYPVYEMLLRKTGKKNLSAFIVAVILILMVTLPSAYILNKAAKESQYLYVRGRQKLLTGDIFGAGCDGEEGTICRYSRSLNEMIMRPDVRYHLEEAMQRMSGFFSEQASSFILSIPFIILQAFIIFFVMFYLLKDGRRLLEYITGLMPLKEAHKKRILSKLSEMTFAVIYGTIVVAFIQGVVGGFGYYIFGLPSVLMLAMTTTVAALLPFIGTAIVWLPISVSMVLAGLGVGNNSVVWSGIGLMLYGTLIISSMDNVVRPYIIGKKSGVHPVLVMLGALGGIYLLGFVGFIVGPIIIEMFIVMLEIYKSEKDGKKCLA
jgi:predicted PurR-regulated permease PerM